ncbi:molybdopterin molybdotransferase MoeA [Roseospira visakhapatnamensis]|uniref:Molybdopterin molybdenumtransferase n=1 Tax=Roseospira visakhapatnamensis TaxID=390880 RepID=A0A7W6W9I9_9PROT|nr:gephyrin-like molybdotransferase Glp [Roseospira visakhapatnamensis]MBB4265863.1 molybdopterin molybdotransferase [Roseospira visakhapatnamensis]
MSAAAGTDCFAVGDHLMPLDEALALLAGRLAPVVTPEPVPLRAATGRVLAQDVAALCAHPAEDRSAMDGYAARHADLSADAPVTLPVAARVAAGHPLAAPVPPGAVVRIFTGGVVPGDLDTVVMQEDCTGHPDGRVTLPAGVPAGRHVRAAGGDFRAGDPILPAGRRLRAPDIALAASAGHATLPVFQRVRVGVFSTGDEVREPGEPLGAGGVYDGNRHGIMAALETLGAAVTDLGRVPDDPSVLRTALDAAADGHHLLVTSGGVSVGGEDHVRDVVADLGALHFWRLAIKPGKPAALGHVGDAAFVGLPGNPVSAMVTLLLIARPVLQRLSGETVTPPRRYPLPAGFHHRESGGRRTFLRAWVEDTLDGPVVRLFRSQDSAMVSSLGAAGGLVDLPAEAGTIAPGDPVAYLPFHEVLA